MVSLKLQAGTPLEVKKGYVTIEGPCVILREVDKTGNEKLIKAYHLLPGEIVRHTGEDNYVVE